MRGGVLRRRWAGRGLVASVAVAALTLVGSVTPAEASAATQARRVAEATLAEVRSAAAEADARVVAENRAPEPAAEGTIQPDRSSTIRAGDLGVSATFSGNEVPSELTVTVGEAPDNALRAARSEAPDNGTPVSEPVEIVARDATGAEVTQFPAKQVNVRGGGEDGPMVSDVIPGLSLELKPDLALVTKNELDPATLQIYTREAPGDPWTALPSYYDAKAGVVKGVSTHLSQFVVIGIPFPVPAGPVVVLDPDNDEGRVTSPAPPVSELGYNINLAQRVALMLEQNCRAQVTITRQNPAEPFVPRTIRAGIAAARNPAVTLGIGFNTNQGVGWGSPTTGGSQVYSRGGASDNAVSDSLVGVLPTYTQRPARNMGNNGNFPGDEFAGLPNAFTHLEALFLDHNFDRPIIDDPEGMRQIGNGVLTGLGLYLESQGFDCTDPVTGGWPSPPSAADVARWRQQGHQNHQTYGGEPFSFSTGNLIEDEKLFSLPGAGGSSTDLTLTYNSQDGRLTRVGAGWSFDWGARAQRFIDGTVMVVRGDGASFMFAPDGGGGFAASDAGVHQTLVEQPGGRLRLADASGESWIFDASNIDGIGNLVSYTDAEGRTTTLSYGPADPDTSQFFPLRSITDSAGQIITVDSDVLGRVTGFTRPGGDRWTLEYDAAGNLTTIRQPDGRTKVFTYDAKHQLLTAVDATGALYLRNEYDAQGRVSKQWDAEGNLRTLDYSKSGQTAYTDNLGRVSVYFYDDRSRITKVQHPDGTTASFRYDADDNVTSSTDENGARTAYTYDAAGNVTSRTAPDGTATKYTYTSTGHVATETDSGGPSGAPRTWSFDYDASGRLVAEHQPDGTTVSHAYDARGNRVRTTQPSGAATTFTYDGGGRLTATTDAEGRSTRFGYDAAGRMVSQTDPGGHTTTYAWDSGDRMVTATNAAGSSFRYGYEPNDHLSSLTDPTGAVTRYSWDAMFHLTDSTSPSGAVTRYTHTAEDALAKQVDPLGGTTSYTSDDRDRTIKTVDPNGGEWAYAYDGVGNLVAMTTPTGAKTSYAYDSAGNLLSETGPTGGKTTYSYDAVGRLTKQIDPDGVATTFSYDALDHVTAITDGSGKRTRLGYDVDGNLTSMTDRTGNVTAFSYDRSGRLLSRTSPLGAVTTYGYDLDGNVTSVTDPLGRATNYAYDALHQLVSVTDPAGNATTYTYDLNGRRASVTDANDNTTSYTYDADGNNISITDPTGASTTYGWDANGNQTSLTDAGGHVTAYRHDPAGQLTEVVEGFIPDAKPAADVNASYRYAYDADGNLTSVVDPNGHTTRYTVDAAGRVLSEVNPVGNTSRWEYTKAGRISKAITGTGATTAYTYDKRGDLIRQDQAGAVARFEYDANQRLIAMTDPTGVSGWVYDEDGRHTTQIDQSGGRLVSEYDKAGQRTAMTLPTGQKLSYTYDPAGRMTSQTSPWGSLSYAWDQTGNLTEQRRSSGVTTSYGYDAFGRVTGVKHVTPVPEAAPTPTATPTPVAYASGDATAAKCTTVAGYLASRSAPAAGESSLCTHTNTYLNGRTLPAPPNPVAAGGVLEYGYEYDVDGNLAAAKRTIADPTKAPKTTSVDYRYDRLDRLASSVTSAGEKNTYGYDPAGNRVSWKRAGAADGDIRQTAEFNDANQLMKSVTEGSGRGVPAGVASFSYDAAGNRTAQNVAGTSTSSSFNPAGQPTQVAREGRQVAYAYDGLGRRATTTDETKYGVQTQRNTFDGSSVIQTATSGHGTQTSIRDAVGALAQHVTDGGEPTWDLLDGLGSTVAGAVGAQITDLSRYEDWGDQVFESGSWSAPENYTGHPFDPTQGRVLTAARSYDPATGTWTAPDTWRGLLTEPKSLARYEYAWDNPSTWWDPDGHKCAARSGNSDALPLGCGSPPVRTYTNVKMPPPAPPYVPKKKSAPKATGPKSKSNVQARHVAADYIIPGMKLPNAGRGTAVRANGGSLEASCGFLIGEDVLRCMLSGPDQAIREGVASAQNAIRDFARSEPVQTVANILAGAGKVASLISWVLDITGVGIPVGVPLGAIGAGATVTATAIYCAADPSSTDCLGGGVFGPEDDTYGKRLR